MPRRLALIALALLLVSCGNDAGKGRVMVLGLDGLDPQTVDLLMAEGKLPNFARLRQEGAYGRLETSRPILSPIIWTTIATGKTPDQHGIGHFVAVNPKTGEDLPVTSRMRKVKALWNILSDAGRRVDVVGWWATWPPENVNGSIVSDHTCYHFLFSDGEKGAKDPVTTTHPPELEQEIAPLVRRPADIGPAEASAFVSVPADEFSRPFDFKDDLSHFRWALATADTYRRIGLHLWKTQKPDALFTYVEATDSTAHLFGHLFRAQGLTGELGAQQARYGQAVESMYRYADGILGDFIQAMDPSTTLIVLSDHGFELGALPEDPSKTRDMRRVSEKYHRIEGILYMYGRGVRPHARIDGAKIVDIAPTVLALAGLGRAQDMPGRILSEALDIGPEPTTVASYETGERVAAAPADDAAVDPAIKERLKSLGYLGGETSPQGARNLAAMNFEAGRYQEAAEGFEKLLEDKPDDAGLHASLAGALGALGRYDESLKHLNEAIRLEPLNAEAYHNRAVIYERQGNQQAAITEYRTALRYDPQYAPSRDALARLGATAGNQPESDTERLAMAMADRASRTARRGDYAEAMKILAEAARIAPRYALVQQYRANVAYLMGDKATAVAALKRALELEPDNALYKENLRRLEKDEGAAKPAPAKK
jgi:predicted AlkP superfamily phosphohydrolase/phosphomutase/tetratricopeptide (TPR) repeat protein